MSASADDRVVPVRERGLEAIPLADGGAEVVVARTRRLRLGPDALWLLERVDGRRDAAALASEMGIRFGRPLAPGDALDLLRGTLVAQGLVRLLPAGAPGAPSPPVARTRRTELIAAGTVRGLASALAPLAAPLVVLPLLAAALATTAVALARLARAGAGPWRDSGAWAIGLGALGASLLAHELGHAIALRRAGGTPGAVALLATPPRARLATELAGLEAIAPLARAAVDVAGAAAQVMFAGVLAALALAGAAACAPGAALVLVTGLAELVPLPGTDGRWLLDDLARHDPADALRRPVSPARWLDAAWTRLATRVLLAFGRGPQRELAHLLPVFVSASFPSWSPARLRTHARRHLEMLALSEHDQRALVRGAMAEDVRHVRPIRALLRERRGAVVCGMHVGPYMFVPDPLMRLGARVLAYAAQNQQRAWSATWTESAARRGWSFEVLSPASTRDAVRAVRAVRDGAMLYLLMDGQAALSRDQHRADFRFLGSELYLRTGPALLARHAGAPTVLAASWYQGAARRVVEFSDPLPPLEDPSEAALVARTAEMYAWFETRVERVPEQWDGWVWPMMHWRATGGSPTATPAEIGAARTAVQAALAGRSGATRLVADPTRVNMMELNGEHLIVHGPERRVLVGDPLATAALRAAFRRTRVRDLPARTGAPPAALEGVLARLVLAGLATLEG